MAGPMSIQHPTNESHMFYERSYRHDRVEFVCKLIIRRKTLFYTVNLIIPTVLISFLSIFVFYLPTDAGEKMTLSISILLALVVFLLLISKILPPTSTVIPLIAKYLLFTFIMNIITIFCTVVIINYNYRTPRTSKMPYWMRRLFIDILPRILRMERPNKYNRETRTTLDENDRRKKRSSTKNYTRSSRILSIVSSTETDDQSLLTDQDDSNHPIDLILTQQIYDAAEDLSFIANQMRSACHYEEVDSSSKSFPYVYFVLFRFEMIGNILRRLSIDYNCISSLL